VIDRRTLLAGAAAIGLAGTKAFAAPERARTFGPEGPFDFEMLIGWAKNLSLRPFRGTTVHGSKLLEGLNYDTYQQIKFRPELPLWPDDDAAYPVEPFHIGRHFDQPVRIFAVSNDGLARELLYNSDLFTWGNIKYSKSVLSHGGFAGFRVLTGPGEPDWLSFLGASYFRSPGETRQFGLSARGLAINVAMPEPEEFPHFTAFWLEQLAGKRGIVVNALLDSPSITGAFRMEARRETGTVMAVQAHLFPRVDIERVGVAPLTSMFWYGKHNRLAGIDWRPEIHDSDGLAIWTGAGERIWRPLNNPSNIQTSTFFDVQPKGFGLMQRERRFSRYEDGGALYHKRPSLWVEPLGDWGEGAVQLVEIPTDNEVQDNIVAYWAPKESYRAGRHYEMRYRLHWRSGEPYPPGVARAVATRLGAGGVPGGAHLSGTVKYAVDFQGGRLNQFSKPGEIEAVITSAFGSIERKAIYRIAEADKWRVTFDFKSNSSAPEDIRLYLCRGKEALSETWLLQHLPHSQFSKQDQEDRKLTSSE
jgi:glucans biosynthesis protein